MISLTLRVATAEGESEYVVTPRVQVDFERQFKVGLPKALANEQKVEHLYWLAWASAKAHGAVVKPFDGWLETVTEVSVAEQPPVPFFEEG